MPSRDELSAAARRLRRKLDVKFGSAGRIRRDALTRFLARHAAPSPDEKAAAALTIGVVIPCFGHAKYLPAAFSSLLAQTRPPDQVVLVDDASPDDTWPVACRLADGGGRLRPLTTVVLHRRNFGQCAAINTGVQMLKTEVVVVLNDDDYLMHDAVESALDVFLTHPEVRLVGAKAVYVYGEKYLENHRKLVRDALLSPSFDVRVASPDNVPSYRTGREIDMCHSGSAFFKTAWAAAGGYEPSWRRRVIGFADRDFQLRVNALFPIAVVENAAFAFWRIDSSVDRGLFS
jgi:glycosyltransferase involved in cell wall biosynthesis